MWANLFKLAVISVNKLVIFRKNGESFMLVICILIVSNILITISRLFSSFALNSSFVLQGKTRVVSSANIKTSVLIES